MYHFQSVFLDRTSFSIPGLRVFAFALHPHPPENSNVEYHGHGSSQLRLCLSCEGRQIFESVRVQVASEIVFVLSPKTLGAFERTTARATLCLEVNFRLKCEQSPTTATCNLTRFELTRGRQELARLLKLKEEAAGALLLESAAIGLQMSIIAICAAHLLGCRRSSCSIFSRTAILHLLSIIRLSVPMLTVVRKSGYARDHLNCMVKKQTGMPLGRLQNQQRLTKAKELPADGVKIGSAPAIVGILDQSYFPHTFRRQTGSSPFHWIRATRGSCCSDGVRSIVCTGCEPGGGFAEAV